MCGSCNLYTAPMSRRSLFREGIALSVLRGASGMDACRGKNLPSTLSAALRLFRFQWIAHAAIFPQFVPKGSNTDA